MLHGNTPCMTISILTFPLHTSHGRPRVKFRSVLIKISLVAVPSGVPQLLA